MRARAVALVLLATACGPPSRGPVDADSWRTADAQAMSRMAAPRRDATCRGLLRPTVGGTRLRLRLSAVGAPALDLAAVTVGRSGAGAAVEAGSVRTVSVGGRSSFSLPASGTVTTDPVAYDVRAGEDLAVSLALRGTARPAEHGVGASSGWCSADGTGDLSQQTGSAGLLPAGRGALVVDALEVDAADDAPPGVVAVGDSLTDPPLPPDQHARWTDRLAARMPGTAVANAGIGGNRVALPGGYGPVLVERFGRDVLDLAGTGTVVLLAGTNDVSVGLSAEALLARLEDLCRQARRAGKRVVVGTLPPAERRPEAAEQVRLAVNEALRRTGAADQVLDADALLRDPARPRRLLPAYDLGDALHLSTEGHRVLGDAVADLLQAPR